METYHEIHGHDAGEHFPHADVERVGIEVDGRGLVDGRGPEPRAEGVPHERALTQRTRGGRSKTLAPEKHHLNACHYVLIKGSLQAGG